jgi:short-subunit dehydrogenase
VETGFQERAGTAAPLGRSRLLVDVREVARAGYEGMKHGQRLVIPGWKNRLAVESLRVSPRSVVTKMVSRMHEKKK